MSENKNKLFVIGQIRNNLKQNCTFCVEEEISEKIPPPHPPLLCPLNDISKQETYEYILYL